MHALHSTTDSAVVHTRLHAPLVPSRVAEKSGVVSGRGCVRGTGRQRPSHITAVDGLRGKAEGENRGNGREDAKAGSRGETRHGAPGSEGEHGEAQGERRERATDTGSAETAFTDYVRERRASLFATAYHLTGDRYEAEDLLQSALFSTYRAWDRISDKAALGGYLRRTMTNLHISAWRRRKLNEYPTEELPETTGEQDAMRGTELRTVLWQALTRLPEQQRTMLVLRYYEGRTDPEIADILNISVGTVKSSIWRSLRRLREDEALSFGRDHEESFGELVA